MLPQKMLKFRVSEMPSPGFSAGHFQYIMRQKCSRKLFILAISLVFSVSYSVPKSKKKKKYKNNEDRSQAKGEALTLKTGKLRYQPVNIHVVMFMYMKDC